jgi:hypothetical protein
MLGHAPALTRIAAVRHTRPPKRPARQALRPLPIAISLPALLIYSVAASYTHHPAPIGLLGVVALCHVDELAVWWRWRAWSAWSGEPICWSSRVWSMVDWLIAASLWLAIGSALAGLP